MLSRRASIRTALLAGALTATLAAAGLGEDLAGASASGAAAEPVSTGAAKAKRVVRVKGFRFRPSTVTVPAGTTIVWRNQDQILHTVTPADAPTDFGGTLDGKGSRVTSRFATPGTYEYFCSRHTSMRATVVVR